MRNRKNRRDTSLAFVRPDKAEEDAQCTSGENATYYFFDKEDRRPYKIDKGHNIAQWVYDQTRVPVTNGRYMYAVSRNGALYIGSNNSVTVHSQFKAGKEVQCAGWLEYRITQQVFEVTIDNCSGHYQPSLEQFIQAVIGLHEVEMLPDQFHIKLNKCTPCIDPILKQDHFWANLLQSAQLETTIPILVQYRKELNAFVFNDEQGSQFHFELSSKSKNATVIPQN